MDTHGKTKAVLGPFSAREVTYLGGAALLVLASLFSLGLTRGDFAVVVLALLLPLAAAVGVAWRRLRGRSRLDFGSFSLDQLAGVVGVGALVISLGWIGGGFSQVLALVGSLALVAATFGSGWIRDFAADFVPQEGVALLRRDVRGSSSMPDAAGAAPAGFFRFARGADPAGTEATAGTGPAPTSSGTTEADAKAPGAEAAGTMALPTAPGTPKVPRGSFGATSGEAPADPAPFWFAVPDARPAFNRGTGAVEFTLTPGEWWLAVRTLPEGLVVRHDDGREALLRDATDLERG